MMGKDHALLARLSGRRVVVLGDLVADEYILGEAERISREAPVLILNWQERFVALGGATNTAHNISALGGEVAVVGVVGADPLGTELCANLARAGINPGHIIVDPSRPTTAKTRILAGGQQAVKQQLVRIDKLSRQSVSQELEREILGQLSLLIPQAEALLISDYGLGVITEQVREGALTLAHRHQLPVAVDSRYQILSYSSATVLTPNLEEVATALGKEPKSEEELVSAGKELLAAAACQAVVITRGEDGMIVVLADGSSCLLPALQPTQVYDVTGAGDTVIGVLTLCLAAGSSVLEGAVLANTAAGLVVRKLGTATITPQELQAALGKLPKKELKLASNRGGIAHVQNRAGLF